MNLSDLNFAWNTVRLIKQKEVYTNPCLENISTYMIALFNYIWISDLLYICIAQV